VKVSSNKLFINNVAVTSSAADLNQLNGLTLGTAATAAESDFATAAQGATADTALQIVAVDGVTITGDGTGGSPLVAATQGLAIGDTVTGATQGSVLFTGASSVLAQDNANLFFDDSTKKP